MRKLRNPSSVVFAIGVCGAIAAGALGIADHRSPEGSDYDRAAFRASQAAIAATQGGTVISVDQQKDTQAPWEVEVAKPNGARVDVMLDDRFTVTKIVPQTDLVTDADSEKLLNDRTSGPAARAALKAMGGGTVQDVDRNSENGAVWEVEVKRPDGSRADILLDEKLRVTGVHVKGAPETPAMKRTDFAWAPTIPTLSSIAYQNRV
jgi:uncharacterized membrane protein YkoI